MCDMPSSLGWPAALCSTLSFSIQHQVPISKQVRWSLSQFDILSGESGTAPAYPPGSLLSRCPSRSQGELDRCQWSLRNFQPPGITSLIFTTNVKNSLTPKIMTMAKSLKIWRIQIELLSLYMKTNLRDEAIEIERLGSSNCNFQIWQHSFKDFNILNTF